MADSRRGEATVIRNPIDACMAHFASLEDPRSNHGKRHVLVDIVAIAILAVICGADDWVAVEVFAQARAVWLHTFLDLPFGIPSQYTFRRVFAQLDPDQFRACFMEWVHAIYKLSAGQVIAIDGKTLRRSHDHFLGREAIQIVSAWAQENRLVLAQTKVDSKSNEITAIPELLKTLGLTGSIITIDAIGCQREHAEMIVDRGGDYVLAVKGNQEHLNEDAQALFEEIEHPDIAFIEHDHHKTVEKNHGRIETRVCWTLSDPDCLTYLRGWENWKGLKTVAMVKSTRVIDDKTTTQVRYFISSLPGSAERILAAVRSHWSIENSLHWVLDMAFREDESRLRKDHGAENMALLRQLALNLIKQDRVTKAGVKNRRLRAALDNDYLLSLLAPT